MKSTKAKTETKKAAFLRCYENNLGHISNAAKAAGIHRRTYLFWMKDLKFREAMEHIDQSFIDLAVDVVMRDMKNGNVDTAMWYLERKAKDRGYGKEEKLKVEQSIVVKLPESLERP